MSSRSIPRYLTWSLRSSKELVPSTLSLFLGDLTTMKLGLEKLIDNLAALHQILTFFNSVLISCSRVLRSRAEAKTFESSANILKVSRLDQ